MCFIEKAVVFLADALNCTAAVTTSRTFQKFTTQVSKRSAYTWYVSGL